MRAWLRPCSFFVSPLEEPRREGENKTRISRVWESKTGRCGGSLVNLGLGIDAGGTYTDAVLVDLDGREVLAKGKALTTKGDYTLGVCRAIDALNIKDPGSISMVALS
ncbi:MAG: hypothetical protein GX182_04730, partial [Firmicutes bacterium]|nr:hypothetical protein [Bacillota bacterium]